MHLYTEKFPSFVITFTWVFIDARLTYTSNVVTSSSAIPIAKFELDNTQGKVIKSQLNL